MESSILESSEEKTNGWKLMRLIADGGTEALRKVFLSIHTGKLHHVLATHHSTLFRLYKSKKIITQPQWDKLYPHPPRLPNIQELDITILVVLLRNICSLPAPSTRWDVMPSSTDKSLSANIVRIKLFRNNFFGHVPGTAISRLDFEDRWVKVSSTLLGLGLSRVEIDRLKAEECGEEEVNRVRKKWNESERECVLKLDRIELKLDQLEKTLEEVRTLSHESSKQVKSSSDNIIKNSLHCFDFESDIQLLLRRYTKGTREWVFEQVLTWLNNKSSPHRVFIITGQAGMGKSIIAAVICKLFPEHFAACHFFQYNNSRYNSSKFLLQSLAFQLSNVFPKYKEELTTKLSCSKDEILNDMNIEGLFSLLFTEPFINCISNQCKPFLIVIDALDESRQEDRYELVDLIKKHFHKLPNYIRFLITTRQEKDIVLKFQALNPIFLQPDEDRNLNDLRVFFEKNIETKTEVLVENFVKKSEGLMLYASFIAKHFEDNFSISNIESFPKGIEEIYENYFKRLEEEMRKLGIEADKFLSLLSVVAVAKQPLPLRFIEKLFCPEKDLPSAQRMLLQLISCVSSLLFVKDECISIFHKSVRDWLLKPGHSFTIIEINGHKILADISVDQMQTLKNCKVRFTYDPAIDYALQYGIPHILEAKMEEKHALEKVIDSVIDLEIVQHSVCINVDTTLQNFVNLTNWNMYDILCEGAQATIIILIRIIRKFSRILQVTPQSFLQQVVNEKVGELSAKASALLMTRFKELAYFESDDRAETAFISQVLTRQKIVEVDISPSENFLICGYEKKGIELFCLPDLKPLWKIDNLIVEREKDYGSFYIVPRCIVFHPFLNIVFPGKLDLVLNLEGQYESGPLICENAPVSFTLCCFSHDHTNMVTKYDNHLIVWNLRNNKQVVTLPCHSTLYSISFSGNDRYIAATEPVCFKVYDTENSYSMMSLQECDKNFDHKVIVSTCKLGSWYCWSKLAGNISKIIRYNLTAEQKFYINFFLFPRNPRAEIEFQAVMENKTPIWFQKLGSFGNFFILDNRSVLFFKCYDHELRIFQINDLIKGSELKQECDDWSKNFVFRKDSVTFSVDGRYIYSNSPHNGLSNMRCSIAPGKSWKRLPIDYPRLIPVRDGVFCMKRNDDVTCNQDAPELWNADFTKRLFNFPELIGTCRFLSVTENVLACITCISSEVRFFDIVRKEIVACTQLPQNSSSNLSTYHYNDNIIACGSQYHVVYTKDKNTLLLQKTDVIDLSKSLLINLETTKKYINIARFSLSGSLLAFLSNDTKLIHVLDISTITLRCIIPLHNCTVWKLEFFDEEHLLCKGVYDCLFLINVKTRDILTSISSGLDYSVCSSSVCHKTGDIVLFNPKYKTFKLFKLWLPYQRKGKNR